jgi:hypothetical protein
MSEVQSSDALKKLVQVMICLAVLGTIIALAVYFGLILPGQVVAASLAPPMNV